MSDFDPDYRGDNDWLLGVAKLRASQIIALIEMSEKEPVPLRHVLSLIRREAQAILDDKQ